MDTAKRSGGRPAFAGIAAPVLARIADAIVDPRIVLAWFLTFVGAPGLVGLLVPVREGSALLARRLAASPVSSPVAGKPTRIATSVVPGLAAFGIAGAGLLLWGATAGWTILGLLFFIGLAAGIAAAGESTRPHRPAAQRSPVPSLRNATGALALLTLAIVLAFELGPRGALVIWAIMAAGGLWLFAAFLLAAELPRPASECEAPEQGGPQRSKSRRLAVVRFLVVPAALAPPYMVALVSQNPGASLAALGGLLLASALATLLSEPLLSLLDLSRGYRLSTGAGLAAAALILAALADVLGWIGAPFLLPILVFVVIAADRAARSVDPETLDAPVALGMTTGVLLAPLSSAVGLGWILLLLAVLLALAAVAALGLESADSEGA